MIGYPVGGIFGVLESTYDWVTVAYFNNAVILLGVIELIEIGRASCRERV